MDLVGLGLRLVHQLLLLGLLGLELALLGVELGLDGLHLADGRGVGVGHAVGVVDAAHEVLEAGGIEQDGEDGDATGLVVGGDAAGKRVLGLGELGLLGLDLFLGGGDLRLGVLEVALELLELLEGCGGLGLVLGGLCLGLLELSLEVGRRRGEGRDRHGAKDKPRAKGGNKKTAADGGGAVFEVHSLSFRVLKSIAAPGLSPKSGMDVVDTTCTFA